MIARVQGFEMLKAIAECAWDRFPDILAEIPVTAVAGKVLREIQKICEDVKTACELKEGNDISFKEALNQLIAKCGGIAEFKKKLREELKEARDNQNPKYINAVIFCISDAPILSGAERTKLFDVLIGESEAETEEIEKFVNAFCEDYFASDYEACDYPIEVGVEHIAFNFDTESEHPYNEEDLELIMDMLNKILGREVFNEYEGLGMDDNVGY